MLKLPGDELVTIELVADPPELRSPGLSHIVVTVTSLDAAIAALRDDGIIDVATPEPRTDPDAPRTVIVVDPDGNRIELVEWPTGHADGFTAADWPG